MDKIKKDDTYLQTSKNDIYLKEMKIPQAVVY